MASAKKHTKKKVIIFLKNSQEIHLYLSLVDTNSLIDQIYSVFSGEFDDNCIEIVSNNELGRETILLKADEILYVRTQEDVADE
jgi:GTP-binding protein EngB required for normal cell division